MIMISHWQDRVSQYVMLLPSHLSLTAQWGGSCCFCGNGEKCFLKHVLYTYQDICIKKQAYQETDISRHVRKQGYQGISRIRYMYQETTGARLLVRKPLALLPKGCLVALTLTIHLFHDDIYIMVRCLCVCLSQKSLFCIQRIWSFHPWSIQRIWLFPCFLTLL